MALKEEIAEKRKDIVVDSYPMSIGEMANLYKDGELDVHPEFQRFFRWDAEQKTKLIESILLGIPIPPIFVSQKINGTWDVIDGQQRLSTILQFLQILKKDDGSLYEPLTLQATKFLPSLGGVRWDDDDCFLPEQKLVFKREKLNFTIIKETTESDTSKYEMFQRLNTNGTRLSAQEIRNCLMVMIDKKIYEVMNELHDNIDFKTCTPLTDSQFEEQYGLELVVRYLLYVEFTDTFIAEIDKTRNMDAFLTEELEVYAQSRTEYLLAETKKQFFRVFSLLNNILGENSFKKFHNDKFKGPLMIAAFEAIIPGLAWNLDYWETNKDELRERIADIYTQKAFAFATRRGIRALDRMTQLIKFSRMWFAYED